MVIGFSLGTYTFAADNKFFRPEIDKKKIKTHL